MNSSADQTGEMAMDDFGNDVYDFYGHENYDSASYDSFFNFVIDGLMWDDYCIGQFF
jgi:hypothetical protein